MLYRLADVATHDALILLRYSVSATRLLHTLRCCPCADHRELTKYDTELRSDLSMILNLPLTDEAWIQASLPMKRGELGIRSVTSLAIPAYLASAASTVSLQDIMMGNAASTIDEIREELKIRWSTASTTQSLEGPLPLKQSAWDKPLLDKTVADPLDRQPDQINQARFKAISASQAGDRSWPCLSPAAVSDLMTRRSGLLRAFASGFRSVNLMDAHMGPRSPQTVTTGYPALLGQDAFPDTRP